MADQRRDEEGDGSWLYYCLDYPRLYRFYYEDLKGIIPNPTSRDELAEKMARAALRINQERIERHAR